MIGYVLTRLLIAVLAVSVLAMAGGYAWLRSTLPVEAGRLSVAGLQAPVEIVSDEHGIPTIRARSLHDGYVALGYLHARDRLFQMELQRRYGTGRLAEILGSAALPADRQMRVLGFAGEVEGEVARLSPDFRAALDAYAAGVNAWIAEGHRLPVEYYLLGFQPAWWRPADTLIIGKLLALELSGNYRRELERASVAASVPPDRLPILFPDYPKDGPVALGKLAALYRDLPLRHVLAGLPPLAGPTAASNDWVVDGKHSVTGKPLLANDPHLGFSIPGVWYLARLEAPGTLMAGGTMAGAPLFVLGHNGRIAWGYTTTNADVEDVFIEKLDPKDSTRYLTPDGSAAFATRQEVIHVRGGPDAALTVRSTRHGVVISDFGDSGRIPAGAAPGPGEVLALETSFTTDDDTSLEAQWRLDLATDWSQFVAALKGFVAPAQNIVYADVDGHIGFYVPGRIPIRKSGDGTVPVPGWTGAFDWTGWIPFEALPHAFDPPSGHIATANNKIVPDDYPYLIAKDWELPYRAARIETLLAADPKQSIDLSAAIQRDELSLAARQLVGPMLAALPQGATGEAARRRAEARALLAGWDDTMRKDQPAPLIFAAWLDDLVLALASARLPQDAAYGGFEPLFVLRVLTTDPAWCEPKPADRGLGCGRIVAAALDRALDRLAHLYGPNLSAWRWGTAHPASFASPVLGRVPLLRDLVNRALPDGGGIETVHASGYEGRDPAHPYAAVHGPTLRAIYDLSKLDRSVFMAGPGQSGDFLSPHYADLLMPLLRGDWLELSGRPDGSHLRMEPLARP